MATGVNSNSSKSHSAGLATSGMGRYVYDDFRGLFIARATATPMGDPTGTAGDVNTLFSGRGHQFQYHVLGTQTILAPKRVAGGLDITQDLTNNDGVEYTLGCEDPANTVISALSRGTFTVGTDKPFGFSLKLLITDVSGTDDCAIGFRKSEAYQANVDDYDEAAAVNIISGDIKIETILNNAATTTTDTTLDWADAATKTISVYCDSDGSLWGTPRAVYYEIDGAKPTAVPTTQFRFDSGEVVIPFFYFLNDTDVAESTVLVEWESGLVEDMKTLSQRASQA